MHHGQKLDTTGRLRLTAVLIAAAVALTGCTPPEQAAREEPAAPTRVSIGVVGELTSFNAATATGDTAANRAVSALMDER
ncbi:MAG: hypothetical protein FJW64_13865, partial [Actinobacteria bacterium]|nr:hypothetical protein [Actinomycetota bacterium]